MATPDDLPLSRVQVHALRVVVESAHGSPVLEIPREGLEQLITMAELCRTPGCKRCGIAASDATCLIHPQGRDKRGRVMRFCTESCMREWDAIENPEARHIARAYFSGHAVISLDAAIGDVPDFDSCEPTKDV